MDLEKVLILFYENMIKDYATTTLRVEEKSKDICE